jgi:hypothetical protein
VSRREPVRRDPGATDRSAATAAPGRDQSRWTWKDVIAAIDEDSVDLAPQARMPSQGNGPAQPQARAPGSVSGDAPTPSRGRTVGQPGAAQESHAVGGGVGRNGWGFSMRGGGDRGHGLDPAYDRFRAAEPPEPDAPPVPPQSQSAEGALIGAAGVSLNEVFSPHALERIGQRAKNGSQARRRAVREAAPEAVMALAQFLDESTDARARAAAFLRAEGARISELLGRGRASLGSETTRAFLLLDAASA